MTTGDQQAVLKIIRKHIHTRMRNEGMMMREEIDYIDMYPLADELIEWSRKREERRARTGR
jgi:hypothetical protein